MILFYAQQITPRIEYVGKLIFSDILQVKIAFTQDSEEFRNSTQAKINYSDEKFANEFYIRPSRLIFKEILSSPSFSPVWYNGEKYFCKSSRESDLPFDPFAATFYLVTRFEEYTNDERDKLGRYTPQNSMLSKFNLLKKPVVNIWAKLLAEKLKEKYPAFEIPATPFRFISTIDVDNAYAFKHKGLLRTTAATAKNLAKRQINEHLMRKKVLRGKEEDPYDTYDYLDKIFAGNEEYVRFFFLLGDYGKYDKNIKHTRKELRNLIQRIAKKYEVGIHPSFASSQETAENKVTTEKKRLEEIIGKPVIKSRQHFITLNYPQTYGKLIKAGITEDYTLGYASKTGFRAGICTPFYYFDLEKNCTTNLKLTPFQVMDGSMRHYMNLSPEESFREIQILMQEVKNVGGTFVSIWHNESVNDYGYWKGYREVFEEMNKLGFKWANEYQQAEIHQA
jgi:hypothetical protein